MTQASRIWVPGIDADRAASHPSIQNATTTAIPAFDVMPSPYAAPTSLCHGTTERQLSAMLSTPSTAVTSITATASSFARQHVLLEELADRTQDGTRMDCSAIPLP